MTVHGVDYSHYQNPPSTSYPPNASRLKLNGIEFAIIKAWEADSPDPNYQRNYADAVAAGLPTMAYVYLHSSDSSTRMQRCFDYIGSTVLCLDWEAQGVSASVVEAWMDAYETRYARQGMVYYGLYPPATATP